jgi:hypothetical protein
MMFRMAIFGTFMLTTISTATAESTSGALEGFGLIGAWSTDCSQDPRDASKALASRTVFSDPTSGLPKSTTTIRLPNGVIIIDESEVQSAVRVTTDKIKITAVEIKAEDITDNKRIPLPADSSIVTTSILQKWHQKFRIFDQRKFDGTILIAKGQVLIDPTTQKPLHAYMAAPWYEKCLN